MTPREIATLWIVGLAAVMLIIWDHRQTQGTILDAMGRAPGTQVIPDAIITSVNSQLTTNDATPMAGNEFGRIATYGNVLAGDTQPNGLDKVFGNIFDNLAGE